MPHQVTTQDHSRIRKWVEARDGRPSTVKGAERDRDPAGVLRIDFPGDGEDVNRFNKIVSKESLDAKSRSA